MCADTSCLYLKETGQSRKITPPAMHRSQSLPLNNQTRLNPAEKQIQTPYTQRSDYADTDLGAQVPDTQISSGLGRAVQGNEKRWRPIGRGLCAMIVTTSTVQATVSVSPGHYLETGEADPKRPRLGTVLIGDSWAGSDWPYLWAGRAA